MQISFVITNYNTEAYLDECIRSILQDQTVEHEIIVVDDGSKNSCHNILKSYPEVRFFQHRDNLGAFQARLTGLMHVRGEYVYFVDADDFFEKTDFSSLYRDIRLEDADIAVVRMIRGNSDWSIRKFNDFDNDNIFILSQNLIRVSVVDKLFRTNFLKSILKLPLFQSRHLSMAEDLCVTACACAVAKKIIKAQSLTTYHYRLNPQSTSNRTNIGVHGILKHIHNYRTVREIIFQFYAQQRIDNKHVDAMDKYFSSHLNWFYKGFLDVGDFKENEILSIFSALFDAFNVQEAVRILVHRYLLRYLEYVKKHDVKDCIRYDSTLALHLDETIKQTRNGGAKVKGSFSQSVCAAYTEDPSEKVGKVRKFIGFCTSAFDWKLLPDNEILDRKSVLSFLSEFAQSINTSEKLFDEIYALWVTCLNNRAILNALEKYLDTDIQKILQQLLQQINWRKVFEYFSDFELNDFYKDKAVCKPKVSVIIPVFHDEPYLHECLDSIVSQSYKNIEILCVNDVSASNCELILKEYQTQYPKKFTVIENTEGGRLSTRNLALNKASGYYVYFVNANNFIDPKAIERLTDVMSASVDVVVHDTEACDESQAKMEDEQANHTWRKSGIYSIDENFCRQISSEISNKLYKRAFFNRYNIHFKNSVHTDMFFFWEYFVHCKHYYFLDKRLNSCFCCSGKKVGEQDESTEGLNEIRVCFEVYKLLKRHKKANKCLEQLEFQFISEINRWMSQMQPKDILLALKLIYNFVWRETSANQKMRDFYWQVLREYLPSLTHP